MKIAFDILNFNGYYIINSFEIFCKKKKYVYICNIVLNFMKKRFSIIGLFLFLSVLCLAQANSIGKTHAMVMWDILLKDTTSRSVFATQRIVGDTLIFSVYKTLPDTMPYHRIYYFVDDICVRQIMITLKKHTWASGVVSTTISKIDEYGVGNKDSSSFSAK